MSPNRIDAGIAHLSLFPRTTRVHHVKFNTSLWGENENIENQTFYVEYYGSDATWHHFMDYDLNGFSTNKSAMLTYNLFLPRDARGIRFKTYQPNAQGTSNKGRIVLDNILIKGNL